MHRITVARMLQVIGVIGIVASLVGAVVGWRVIAGLDAALDDSLGLTGEALEALDASVTVAEEALVGIERTLTGTQGTVSELADALAQGDELFDSTATLTEDQVAGGLEAVEETLPALIDVAGVIDGTLRALATVPFGPSYDPDEPFDESVRSLQTELSGLPDDLRDQAELIRQAGADLGAVSEGTGAIAEDLGELQGTITESAELLSGYQDTAQEAQELVTRSRDDLSAQLLLLRVLLAVLGVAVAAGQVVPIGAGWLLAHPARLRALLTEPPSCGRQGRPT